MPAVLVEVGFLNSEKDNQLFDARFRETAQAIADGIMETLNASSGETEFLHDFKLFHAEDLSVQPTPIKEYIWCPVPEDHEKWCRCTFAEEQTIREIIFHGNVAKNERILESELLFSNGQKFCLGHSNSGGCRPSCLFLCRKGLNGCSFAF